MERNNDLCFTIDDKFVVLIEHQSTINNNMPLRFLLYVAREYEKILDEYNIYKQKLIKIPTPEFIVLYNGEKNYPKEKSLKLSDAFYSNENIKLELIVDIVNINYDKNEDILNRCKTLNEYSYFIYLVREAIKKFRNEVEEDDLISYSLEKVIKECISKNILKEFLKLNGSEVVNMLSTEFKIEKAEKIWREEAFQDGIERGIERGMELEKLKRLKQQIKMLKELNINNDIIIEKISRDYELERKEVEKYL